MKKISVLVLSMVLCLALTSPASAWSFFDPITPGAVEGWNQVGYEVWVKNPTEDTFEQTISTKSQYTYDAQGRVLTETVLEDSENNSAEALTIHYSYDSDGRLASKRGADGEGTYSYQPDGTCVLIEANGIVRTSIPNSPFRDYWRIGQWVYEYEDGRVIKATGGYDNGTWTYTYVFDGSGKVSQVKNAYQDSNTQYATLTNYNYTSDGGHTERETNDNGYDEYEFNAKGQLIRLHAFSTEGPGYDEVYTYEYDDAGNNTAIRGAEKYYLFAYEKGPAANAAQKPVVQPTSQKLTVNGAEKKTEIYNINGSNYFSENPAVTISGGTISNNSSCNSMGGGIFADGTLNISGAPNITGNVKNTGDSISDSSANNVYLNLSAAQRGAIIRSVPAQRS